jgi:hypothetical protein
MLNCKLEYRILDGATQRKVGTAHELTSAVDALRVFVSQSVLPSTIEVRQRSGKVLFTVEKETRLLSFTGINAKVLDGQRAIVGRIQGKGLIRQLTQLLVLDCDDEEIGTIEVKLRPWQLLFRSRKGKLLGNTKAGGAFVSGNSSIWRWFPRGSIFILEALELIADDPERKMLLLAAPLVYDLNVYDMLYRGK